MSLPPFLSADESAHVGYALETTEGRIPRLDEVVAADYEGQRPIRQHLSNHPPLYHWLLGPLLRWGVTSGHQVAALWLARLFTLALGVATVVVAAGLAAVVVRSSRRRQAVVLTAGLTATVPTFVTVAVTVHNDLLAVLGATVAFAGAMAALAGRPRAWHVAAVCVGAAVSLATRLSVLSVVLLACVGLGAAVLLRTGGTMPRRVMRAGLVTLAPLASAAASSGWYYLRNRRIYGDVSGVAYNRDLAAPRGDPYTPWTYLTDPTSIPDLFVRAENGGIWRVPDRFGPYERPLLWLLVALIGVGAVLAIGGTVRRLLGVASSSRSSTSRRSTLWLADMKTAEWWARAVMLGLVAMVPVTLIVQVSGYVAQTGSPHPRYLHAGIAVIALVVALACLGYPRRLSALLGGSVIGFQAVLTLTTFTRWKADRSGEPRDHPLNALYDSVVATELPAPGVILAVLFVSAAVGVLMQFSALWSLCDVGPARRAPSVDQVTEARGEAEVDGARAELQASAGTDGRIQVPLASRATPGA